jgi:hypothetical protein
MKSLPLLALALLTIPSRATDILTDNFDAPDNANFDASSQAGRRGGLLGPSVQLRSSMVQHGIVGNRLNLLRAGGGEGRVRFHQAQNLGSWHDFASGPAGATISTEDGFKVEFDWLPLNNTDANWVEFSVGIGTVAQVGSEPAVRVNNAQTDFGILFRHNGGSQFFDNGAATNGGNAPATTALRRVVIEYRFPDFNDGTSVSVTASVDGTAVVTNRVFQWDNNLGSLYMELGANASNTKIDNFVIRGLNPKFLPAASTRVFFSSTATGGLVAELSGTYNGTAEAGTFALVPGTGDTDNGLFLINGNRLEPSGALDFLNVPDGTSYSVRIRGSGTTSGTSSELAFPFTLISDTDRDRLGDAWEQARAGNLTDLSGTATGPGSGAGSGNFDGDSLSDAAEYLLSLSGYPNINPKLADSDGDTLEDGAELTPAAPRVATNPTNPDTDGDWLHDAAETNTGTFVSSSDAGTNATVYDSDGDQYPDGFEAPNGGNPLDIASLPTKVPQGFALGVVTDEASTGISTEHQYTHRISGGAAASINGVDLEVLDTVSTPANFAWNGFAGGRNIVGPGINNGEWQPVAGDVSGTGNAALFGTFTYSGAGSTAGNRQTFTLAGLEPGLTYEFRLFVRKWSGSTVRPAALTFTNGTERRGFYLLEDRPGTVLGNSNDNSAYFLSFTYTALATEMTMEALVPPVTSANGSFHMYGLTNRAAGEPPALAISSIERAPDGSRVTLRIQSRPSRLYAVDFSRNLSTWVELTDALPSTGSLTVFEDTIASGLEKAFYRVRDVTPQ